MAMIDAPPLSSRSNIHLLPAQQLVSITPHDTNKLTKNIRGILVGTAGAVKITDLFGNDVTIPNLTAGIIHPIAAQRVFSTGTTAVDIIGIVAEGAE